MKTIFKIRCNGSTRLVEVSRHFSNGGGVGWRVDNDGLRWAHLKGDVETQELIVFDAASIVCEMETDLHYGGLKRKEKGR